MSKKKADRFHVLRGNPSHKNLNKKPGPKRLTQIFPIPRNMPKEGKKLARELMPLLAKDGLLSPLYRGPFVAMCSAYGMAMMARDELIEQGFTYTDNRKIDRKSPLFQIYKDFMRQFAEFATQFGLTPRSRDSIEVTGPPTPTLDEILGRDTDDEDPWKEI
jgi:P27 family predicted phage terminase small subunit